MTGDIALSSASFILLYSNLKTLLTLSDLSRKVFTRVKINFVRPFLPLHTTSLLTCFVDVGIYV